jgi:hypothetical protein
MSRYGLLDRQTSNPKAVKGHPKLASNNDSSGINALSDSRINYKGKIIGPFLGEFQGIPRNHIIAERLKSLTSSDLTNTRIDTNGNALVLYFGEISITLQSADIRAISGKHKTSGYDVGIRLMKALGATVPQKSIAEERGELAIRQARINFLEGQALYEGGSWETLGSNMGPLLQPINESNYASERAGYEWCGMYVGHAFKKAGIRPEILRKLVFWSGYRLHLFFTRGVDVSARAIGSFWQPHQYLELSRSSERRKQELDDFAPRAGDVVLFKSDYSHVGVVDSYDSETGDLEILEGNSGNRVRASTYGSGEQQISFIGRFNNSDFGSDVDSDLLKKETPDVTHTDKRSANTR